MDEISCRVISGPFNESQWGQAYVFEHAYAVVEVVASDAISIGTHIAAKLHEIVQQPSLSPGQLHHAVAALIPAHDGVAIMVGYVRDGVLFVTNTGAGVVVLVRGGTVGVIVGSKSSGSGSLQQGDTVFFLSPTARGVLTDQKLQEYGVLVSLDELRDACGLILHQSPEATSGSVLLALRYGVFAAHHHPLTLSTYLISHLHKLMARARRQPQGKMPTITQLRTTIGTKRGKTALLGGVLLLFMLSVISGLWFNTTAQKSAAVEAGLERAQHAFEQGMALMQLSPMRSREFLAHAHDELEKVGQLRLSSTEKKEVLGLSEKIEEGLQVAKRSYEVVPTALVDLSLVKEGGWADEIAQWEDMVVVLDRRNKAVYQLTMGGKSAQIILGRDQVGENQHIALHGKNVYLQGEDGISRFSFGEKTVRRMRNREERWESIVRMVSFGGNLYLLDTKENQIWKYSEEALGGEIHTYLAPDVFPDFDRSTSLTIDGSVWVAGSNGILKFTYGAPQSFTIVGLDEPIENPAVFSTEGLVNLYILDAAHKRVVATDKDGMYLAQYRWQEDFAIADFLVSEAAKKILLFVGNMVYEVEMK